MKIGIYQATWGGIGGAELYVASMAEILSRSHQVEIIHHNPLGMSLDRLQEVMDVDLSRVAFRCVPKPDRLSGGDTNPFTKYKREKNWAADLSHPYELFVYSGLIVPCFCHAPAGCLLTYFPMETMDSYHGRESETWGGRSVLKKLASRLYQDFEWRRRMSSYRHKLAISEYTQFWLRRYWGFDSQILYPPLRREFGRVHKTKQLVSVGRFDPHIKNYETMVRAFLALCDSGVKDWEYVIVGGLNDHGGGEAFYQESLEHLEKLKSISAGYPVSFLTNLSGAELKRVMESSSVFWHGAGYGVDAEREPGRMEHFGIVTTEAMAAGCVPIVFRGGGQPEIIREGEDGYTWKDPGELVKLTRSLIAGQGLIERMSENARKNVLRFAREAFESRLLAVMSDLLH